MSLSRPFLHRSDHLQNHRSWSWSQESDPYLLQYRHQKLLRLLCPCNQCLQCHHLLQLCLLLLHLDSASDWSGSSGLLHRLLLSGAATFTFTPLYSETVAEPRFTFVVSVLPAHPVINTAAVRPHKHNNFSFLIVACPFLFILFAYCLPRSFLSASGKQKTDFF